MDAPTSLPKTNYWKDWDYNESNSEDSYQNPPPIRSYPVKIHRDVEITFQFFSDKSKDDNAQNQENQL